MSQSSIKPLRLSELTTALDEFFKKKFTNRPVWVIGEVSNHQYYQKNGRHYFNLIEKHQARDQITSQMQAVAWGNVQPRVDAFEKATGQEFTNGLEVLLQVEVTFHPMYGMKLTLLDVDPSFTMGRMEKKRLETLNRLRTKHPEVVRKVGDQYRTFNQDRPLPKVLSRVALVTSSKAAGYDDFLHTLKNNPWGYQFSVDHYFAPVQGMASWPKIASRIAEVNSKFEDYDVVVIVRGGGSRLDLALFDQYELSLEIARCAVPVITGIGHQRDESIADLFCHTRLKTPTKVAEFILAQNLEFEQVLLGANDRIQDLAKGVLKEKKRSLNGLSISVTAGIPQKLRQLRKEQAGLSRKLLTSVQKSLQHKNEILNQHQISIERGVKSQVTGHLNGLNNIRETVSKDAKRLLAKQNEKQQQLQQLIKLADPKNVLKRGYAIIREESGILTSAEAINAKKEVEIEMKDGKVKVKVETSS